MTAIVIGRLTTYITYPQITYNPEPANITAITNAQNAEVTTETDHGFEDDMVVQLFVTPAYGMEINKRQAKILVTGDDTFTIEIDTLQMTAFSVPDDAQAFPAQAVPVTGTLYNTYEQN